MLSLAQLNHATQAEFSQALQAVYPKAPWIAERAGSARPLATLAALKHALVRTVREASRDEQLALIRAHADPADPAAPGAQHAAGAAPAPADAPSDAGAGHCTPDELARIHALRADYSARFGWPFVLALRGPRGSGLRAAQIIATLERRIDNPPEFEFAEALRQLHRMAELRLNDAFGFVPEQGQRVWDWCERLARHSEQPGGLTVTYLSDAHRAAAAEIAATMRDCGFDQVDIDAVGNVVGVYHGDDPAARRLLTGSHYDTVRNAGKYDGRIGHFIPMACVRALHLAGRRLPFGLEVVAFAEEEGQRYKATFLGSGALVGNFRPEWLDQPDRDGVRMRDAMRQAGLPGDLAAIATLRRDPARYLGFVEVHIEQGPVLNALDLPLGIVSSINASVRHMGEIIGMASHAGTTPMQVRRDAACAAAELALFVERRAAADGDSVGTVGMLEVPAGSINVVPGRCRFSLDLRAPSDAQRDGLRDDVLAELAALCARRGLRYQVEEAMRESAAPSDAAWQHRWEQAVAALGLPLHRLPSGAGHDAMKLHTAMPQAMLFVRGEHAGISHNPLESSTADDLDLACAAFTRLLDQVATS